MGLDTKYRPTRYSDVLGQEAAIKVCREIVRQGHGFRQSYVFAGAHGGGKTTMGRILARALLCETPENGEPCDRCTSCKAMLADRHDSFIEVDAATNSGKDHVKRITEEAKFGSFSGGRKLYLFDECHEMSRQAFDALLKPLEDNIRGTQDKQLVCIFCTTEPEKMRSAILSRCAPLFRIRNNTPAEIGARLAYICDQEGLEYEAEVMPLIAEVVECHVRDAIKAVEGVSMLGQVSLENVRAYLQLDANGMYLDLLEGLGSDLPTVLRTSEALLERVSPATCYERMADVCMLAYRLANLGNAVVPSYWDRERLRAAGEKHQSFLLEFAQCFAQRPVRATGPMFVCDISALHHKRSNLGWVAPPVYPLAHSVSQMQGPPVSQKTFPTTEPPSAHPVTAVTVTVPVQALEPAPASENSDVKITPKSLEEGFSSQSTETTSTLSEKCSVDVGSISQEPFVSPMGVFINHAAQNRRRVETRSTATSGQIPEMTPEEFANTLRRAVIELQEAKSSSGRSPRLDNVGSS